MRIFIYFIAIFMVFVFSQTADAQGTIRYVKQGGSGNGSSWANASGDFQGMINASSPGDQVWVAKGIYRPPHRQFFSMKEGVKIYGGFPDTGSPGMSERDWDNFPSRLRGDTNSVIRNENNGLTAAAVLDGFVIEWGTLYYDYDEEVEPNGGGMYNDHVHPTISNCTFLYNFAFFKGSGMYNYYSSPNVIDCVFENNGFSWWGGGGVANEFSSPTFTGCIFLDNEGQEGGGMYNYYSSPIITDCVFQGNNADQGGGISDHYSTSIIDNCTFIQNEAFYGGGTYGQESYQTINNCVFEENRARESGGGMCISYSEYKVTNSIFVKNTASNNGSGIKIRFDGTGSFVNVTLIESDFATNFYLPSYWYNSIIWNSSVLAPYNLENTILQGVNSGNYTENDIFADYANGDYRLKKTSPVVNTGNNAYIAGHETDLDGNQRIVEATVDMGAYEYQGATSISPDENGIVYVKEGGLGDGRSWEAATYDLQGAIDALEEGGEVWVAAGTYLPESGQPFRMKEGVKIYGGFPNSGNPVWEERNWSENPTQLQANGHNVVNNDNNGLTSAAVLDGFILTGGNVIYGGGMFNSLSSPTIANCIFTGNRSSYGGGMYNSQSSPEIVNCIFTENSSYYGGGIYNNAQSNLIMVNVLITGNTAATNMGAALYNSSSNPSGTNLTIVNNAGPNAIYTAYSTMLFHNAIVYGGVEGSYTAKYSIIQGNTDFNNGNIDATGIWEADIFRDPANGDYRLKDCSFLINAGNNDYITGYQTDLDGLERVIDGSVDLGAYEYQSATSMSPDANGIVYVRAGGIGNGSSWECATGNLQGAINAAQTQVWVAGGTYQPGNGQYFAMREGIKILGGFPDVGSPGIGERNLTDHPTILQGNGNSVIRNDHNGLSNSAVLDGFVITGGSAFSGGGMYNSNASPTLVNCTFIGNTGEVGGGIFNQSGSSPRMINVLLTGNTATIAGGAIYNYAFSSPNGINLTIADNTSPNAIFTADTMSFYNAIVYGEINGPYLAQYSLIEGNTDLGNGNLDATGISVTDIFRDPANGDYRPRICPPVRNAGNNDYITGYDTDLGSNPRITEGTVDMGAFEFQEDLIIITSDDQGIIYVKQDGTGDGSSWDCATNDFQIAVNASQAGGQVWIAAGTYQPAHGQFFSMKEGVEIYGGFPATGNPGMDDRDWTNYPTILQGNASNVIRNNNNGLTAVAILDGFTITGGNMPYHTTIWGGGGMYNSNASPTIKNCLFIGNKSVTNGGGMYNIQSSPTLDNCSFIENTATYGAGGGIYNYDHSSPVLNHCTFIQNTADNEIGGGMLNEINSSPILTHCTFTQNSALVGGGICNMGSHPILYHCILTENIGSWGGGISNTDSSITLVNCIIADNDSINPWEEGRGLDNWSSASTFINCLVTGPGVQVSNNWGDITFINTTLSGDAAFEFGTATFNNSLLWGNISGNNYIHQNSILKGINSESYMADDIFEDYAGGNFRLNSCSPARDAGNNDYITGHESDLDGNDRIEGGTVDIGAYEYEGLICGVIWTINNEWLDHVEPDSHKHVIIQGNLNVGIDYNSFSAKSITVENTGSLVITPGNYLIVTGAVTNHAGASGFIVENDANLIQVEGAENTGEITVHRNSSPMMRLDYALWSSPVAGQEIHAFSPQTVASRIYTYEGQNGYQLVPDLTSDFIAGKGYMFRAPNNWNQTTDANNGNPVAYLGEFIGVPFNGNVSIEVHPGSYTSVGNPYPSNIKLGDNPMHTGSDTFLNANPHVQTLYFWTNTYPADGAGATSGTTGQLIPSWAELRPGWEKMV